MDADLINDVRATLAAHKPADLLVEMPDGNKRLMLIPSSLWEAPEPELLIVLESYGSLFFKPSDTLTVFKFIANGFPYHAAVKVYELVTAIASQPRMRLRPPPISPSGENATNP